MLIRSLARSLMVATLLAAGQQLCIVPAASAQAQLPQTQPSVQPPVLTDIPDKKLDAAATALMTVDRVREEFREQFKRIAEDANKAAEKAVTDQGLSVDELKTIIVTAQQNPDVRKKLVRRLPSIE